jgi:hypothetical protein
MVDPYGAFGEGGIALQRITRMSCLKIRSEVKKIDEWEDPLHNLQFAYQIINSARSKQLRRLGATHSALWKKPVKFHLQIV